MPTRAQLRADARSCFSDELVLRVKTRPTLISDLATFLLSFTGHSMLTIDSRLAKALLSSMIYFEVLKSYFSRSNRAYRHISPTFFSLKLAHLSTKVFVFFN